MGVARRKKAEKEEGVVLGCAFGFRVTVFSRDCSASRNTPAAMPRPISLTQRREDTKMRGKERNPQRMPGFSVAKIYQECLEYCRGAGHRLRVSIKDVGSRKVSL
jgi:hypothetical protein